MDVAFTDERWSLDAVFPFADKFRFDVIDHNTGELGFIRYDELDVLGFIDLIGAWQARDIGNDDRF